MISAISNFVSKIMNFYINLRAKGKLSISISRAEVAYLVDYCWSKEKLCTPKDLDRYEISFNLTANSQRNIPTNIHSIELHVEFCSGKTINITDVLKAKTHSASLIEEPLAINVAENGAYSANYSAVLEREDYWRSLDNDQLLVL